MNTLEIEVPKQRTFHLPEGNFLATLREIKPMQEQKGNKAKPRLRFLFEVSVPSLRRFEAYAGRNFDKDLRKGSDLYQFLEAWHGAGFVEKHSGGRLDLNKLLDKPCEVALVHWEDKAYDQPLVIISSIHPVGTLNLTGDEREDEPEPVID